MQADVAGVQRWRRIKEVVQEALSLSEAERSRYLDESCGSDSELRAEVEGLLKSCEDAEDFLESPITLGAGGEQETGQVTIEINSWFGPYKILERLGNGGMGVVFRAHDPKLERDVALKFLSEDLANDSKACERLYREARATSALKHPNIRTVYDICDYAGQTFIVLEFLEGKPLDRREQKILDVSELLSIAKQICSALTAAHSKGIIHRDIKPANVFIDEHGKVSVLDFGIAKVISRRDLANPALKDLTHPATALGTISYMSPEQARGEELDCRTDLFSLGALLYELATGKRAFTGPTNAVIFDQILNKIPPRASAVSEGVPAQLDKIIERLLQKDRNLRYLTAADVLVDLNAFQRELDTKELSKPFPLPGVAVFKRRPIVLVLGGVVILGITAGILLRPKHRLVVAEPTQPVATPAPSRKSIAVLGFKDLKRSTETAWLSTALAEMLTTQLGAGQSFRIISGEDVARTKNDLALTEADSYSRSTLTKIRQNLGADYVVLGSYFGSGKAAGGSVRLYLKLQDAAAGETIASVSQTGTEDRLFDLVSRTASDVRTRLGVADASSAELEGVKASIATNPEVARLYSEGLDRLRLYEYVDAKDLLEKAVALDPQYPLTHAALSEAWSNLGYDVKARTEAKMAFDLSKNLLREGRLWVEGQYRNTNNNFERAIEVYKMLVATSPDDVSYALHLAAVQTKVGNTDEAYQTIQKLRKLPAPYRDDPRIDLAEAETAAKAYEYDRELKAAERAAEKAKMSGARLLLSRVLLRKSEALAIKGRRQDALVTATEARRIYNSVGDTRGAARATMAIASVLLGQGDMVDAGETYRDALSLFRKTGDEAGAALALTNAAIAQDELGDSKGAMRAYREALEIRRRLGDSAGVAQTLANLGFSLYLQGDLVNARKALDEGVPLAESIGYKRIAAVQTNTIGEIEMNLGHLTEAEKYDQKALATLNAIGDKSHAATALLDLALVSSMHGDADLARQRLEQAHKLWVELGDPVMAALARVAMQDVNLRDGKIPADDKTLSEAQQVFRARKLVDEQVWTSIVRTRYFLAKNLVTEAKREAEFLDGVQRKSKTLALQLSAKTTMARVLAEQNRLGEAQAILRSVSLEAKRRALLGHRLEADLHLTRLMLSSPGSDHANQMLTSLKAEASANGFGWIARAANASAVY